MITLEELMAGAPQSTKVGESGYRLIDGDTIRNDEGHSIRLDGINTPEVQHTRDVYSGDGGIPDASGATSFAELSNLAATKGFTEVVDFGTEDVHGRSLGDMRNPETGQLWTMYMAENNLADINKYSSDNHQMAYLKGVSNRTAGIVDAEAEQARGRITEANMQGRDPSGGFRYNALNEREYSKNPDAYSGVAIRSLDRNLMNEAHDQWSTSFDTALISMTESYHGFRQALGQMTENENLELGGRLGAEAARYRMRLNPTTTVSLDQIDGLGTAIDYIGNNAAMSIPYMATTFASGAAGAAAGTAVGGPVGGAAGLGVGLMGPTALYSGQVYNEQDEKNPNVAFASGLVQAVLDRVGLKGIGAAASGPRGALKEAVDQLVARGVSPEAALARVTGATRRELADYMDDAALFASNQVSVRNLSRDMLNNGAKAFGAEAITESTQELFGYMGANWDKENLGIYEEGKFSDDLQNRLINAAVAGGVLGGGIGAAGGAINTGQWANVSHNLSTDGAAKSREYEWAEQAQGGDNQTYTNNLAYDATVDNTSKTDTAFRLVSDQRRLEARTLSQKAFETVYNAPGKFFKKMMQSRMSPEALQQSETYRRMASFVQGTMNRVHGGRDIEGDQHWRATQPRNIVGNVDKIISNYKGIRNTNKASQEFNKDYDTISKDYLAHEEKNFQNKTNNPYDWSKHSPEDIAVFQPLFKRMDIAADWMRNDQNDSWKSGGKNPDDKFKKQSNYLLKYKEMDKNAVEGNENKFIDLLKTHYGYTQADARALMNKMIDGDMDQSVDQDDVFNLMSKGLSPGSHKRRSLGLSQHPAFKPFFHQNLAHNIQAATSSAARFSTYNNFIGKDNWKLEKMYKKMSDEGVPDADVNKLAADMDTYLAAFSGNYKRPKKGTQGYRALAIQQNILLYSVFTALPLSALSSMVELAMVTNGLNSKQIFGKSGSLNSMALEFSKGIAESMRRVVDESWSGHKRINNGELNSVLERVGFNEVETGAATTTGASELSAWKKEWTDRFFRYNGLAELTNRQRAARASVANDFMMSHMDIIIQNRGNPDTNEVVQSKTALRNLGMDINRIAQLIDPVTKDIDYNTLSPNEKKFWDEQRDMGTYNFINDAIALPGSANRPLFYQDPRLAMFTQFNGFIAVFTAHHIPKMWNEYILKGSPSMKYNAFAMMSTMIMLGFVSQYLKDLLKYGETTPYLDDAGKIRRAVNSSGLLGTGERLLNLAFPVFDKNTNGALDAVGTTVLDEMPALSPLSRLYKGAEALTEGRNEEAGYNIARGLPIVGPMTSLAKYMSGNDF
jgi:hypothetical protein